MHSRHRRQGPLRRAMLSPCGKMSPLQALTPKEKRRDPAQILRESKTAVSFIILCVESAKRQVRRGKHFIFEQSRGSAAWGLDEMTNFLPEFEPYVAEAAGCRFNKRDLESGKPFSNIWRFVTDMPEVARKLDRPCDG